MEWYVVKLFRQRKVKWAVIFFAVCCLYLAAYAFGRYVVLPARSPKNTEAVSDPLQAERLAAIENTPLTETAFRRNLAPEAARSGSACPVSFFLTDLHKLDPDETISMMKACNVSTLSIPLVWSFLEKSEGAFDPAEYDQRLEPYVAAGFRFIFLLDGAGRQITGTDGQIIANSLPDWLLQREGVSRQIDFLDRTDPGYGLSYGNKANQALYLRFCEQAIAYFGARYADHLIGFAPCVMNEFEIKYPQTMYAWTDYGIEALAGFRDHLRRTYGTAQAMNEQLGTAYLGFSSVGLPVTAYNNTLVSGALSDDPLFADFQRYREQALVDYVRPVLELIRSSGYSSIAYFAQTLSGQDAIYASGVVTQLASLVDIAVIDFNFYDGYGEVYDSIIPPMLVNYVRNAGYPQVWAGLYFERIPYLDHLDLLQETVDYVAADGLASGFEIGGIIDTFREKGQEARPDLVYGVTQRSERPRIAIYAGEWDFYKDHGEQVRYYNYFSDALTQMYKIIRFELNEPVDVLCDEAVLRGAAEQYELLVLPGQFYVEPEVRRRIENYLADGGKALMDFRFGEWNADGSNTSSWSDEFFGVGAREARREAEAKLVPLPDCPIGGLTEFTVRSLYPGVPNLYATAPANGVHALYRDTAGRSIGLCGERTAVLGFQPQLQYKYAETEQERDAAVAVIRSAVSWLLEQ